MKTSKGEHVFFTVNYVFLALFGISALVPLINILAVSLSDSSAIISGKVSIWPIGWNIEAYRQLIEGTRIIHALKNSIIITVVGVALSMLFTILAAYPLSRNTFYGRRFFTLVIVFTMLFGGGLIPSFMVIKELGLINSYAAIWLPSLVSAFNMMIMRTFFLNIPSELEDAARMDGCGEYRMLLQIFLPLSLPVLATLTLFYSVGYWNQFLTVLLYINDAKKYNLTVLVQNMVASQQLLQQINTFQAEDSVSMTPEAIKAGAVVILLLPLMIVYPFLQKYFVKGALVGAVKG
ncbi:carbohydrate ABC transporter permease [Paenibacillus sp. FSL H7-0331]|uniref:carbohydrate ABC transporter permease n=1 Tax=Paenibacillus sp. FSL H7-0331 TaxID=1920421 RepID=UPI00096DCDA2|nr:carbohydrate ABC transporter permease [Paenibacillus sp. FSL H7-0331]OMF18657.1 ABC transporter permease [Paenibacillus sp. FSL H7-0331]